MIKLKQCPFCGSKAEKYADYCINPETGNSCGLKHFVWCTRCTALVCGYSEQEAVNAWNRRVLNERTDQGNRDAEELR